MNRTQIKKRQGQEKQSMCENKNKNKNKDGPSIYICSTRFNENTWSKNKEFRMKNNFSTGCIYNSPYSLSMKIPNDMLIFVIEMNNSLNEIMGIGLIRNKPIEKHYKIYECDNYHRFQYASQFHIDRGNLPEGITSHFDKTLFRGKGHLKRGNGITKIPFKYLLTEREKRKIEKRCEEIYTCTDETVSAKQWKGLQRKMYNKREKHLQKYQLVQEIQRLFIDSFPNNLHKELFI